jgi:hypothetical protein
MRLQRRASIAVCAALLAAVAATGRATGRVFFDDDPLWVEPITQDASKATRYEPDLIYQTLEGLFYEPPASGRRARNVNTVDEVPDGPFYVNRAGRMASASAEATADKLSPAIVARASNTDDGPAPGKWTVVSAKSDGVTPGFTVRDNNKTLWFIKFDPPGWRGMATGSEIVAAKLLWAAGYHTVEYHIGKLVPSNLVIGPGAKVTPPGEAERPMVNADISRLLARSDRDSDGSYRVILSKAAPGRPVGRIRFAGTRADDPNDLVPHEDHRELRGYRVFSAWLNHVDAKGINSIAVLVTENGRTFIRQYLLDFGSALGSAGIGPRFEWEGEEQLVESRGEIGKRVLSFGFRIPEWRTMAWYEAPSVGRLPRSHATWHPQAWEPHIMNPAFRNLRPDDAFWAADKLRAMTNEVIDAAVTEGQFGDPEAERALARMIRERRDRILQAYLPAVNPITRPQLTGSALLIVNAAVEADVAKAPGGYRATWSRFDNATGAATALAVTTSATTRLPVPPLGGAAFVQVEIAATGAPVATWGQPVTAYFRRAASGWSLVGLMRLP